MCFFPSYLCDFASLPPSLSYSLRLFCFGWVFDPPTKHALCITRRTRRAALQHSPLPIELRCVRAAVLRFQFPTMLRLLSSYPFWEGRKKPVFPVLPKAIKWVPFYSSVQSCVLQFRAVSLRARCTIQTQKNPRGRT